MLPIPRLRTSTRSSVLPVPADAAWAAVVANGPWAWHVDAAPLVFRGALDRLVGGQGRRVPAVGAGPLVVGDRPGLWRVERCDPASGLLLVAEVRAPGTVTLEVVVAVVGPASCRVATTVRLDPDGALGWAYLAADLPARETVVALVHHRVCRAVRHGF